MRNPFCTNFKWLSLIMFITGIILFFPCNCFFYFRPSSTFNEIIIGIFSSSVLLFLNEWIKFISDRHLYGNLEGSYKRKIITEILPKNKMEVDLTPEDRNKLSSEGKLPIPGSKYFEWIKYRDIGINWGIELKYLHNGIYEGIAEYNEYWSTSGKSTKVKLILTLSTSNLKTGSGSYKYVEREDYGTYNFQVNENNNEIILYYKNIIPHGIAEGYEKWERNLE